MTGKLKFELLSDRHDAVPQVARWYVDKWGHLLGVETTEGFIERLQKYLENEELPLLILAFDGDDMIGAAQLKLYEMGDAYPDYEHWLGGVYVVKERRGRGIGSQLVKEIIRIAPGHGVKAIYLQTEALDGGLYARLGWKPVENYQRESHLVLVMERNTAGTEYK